MKIRVPDYYQDFQCIADKCTDTCCAGWEVDVDDTSYAYYKTVEGEFGNRLHRVMIDGKKGQEGRFRIQPDGRCPFLNQENFCDLYTELGEEHLCVTCDQYPRYTTEYGNLRETGIALSCITAAELILKDNRKPEFQLSIEEDGEISLNTIDGTRFLYLMQSRTKAFDILSDRKYSIWQRMILLLEFSQRIQRQMKRPTEMELVIQEFSQEERTRILDAHRHLDSDAKKISRLYQKVFSYYKKQRMIKKEWPVLIQEIQDTLYQGDYAKASRHFHRVYAPREYEFENIMTYFVFRYYMKGVFDGDVLTQVKMGIVSALVILQADICRQYHKQEPLSYQEQVELVHLYSREVEHSEENFQGLCHIFKHKKTFRLEQLFYLLEQEVLL